MSLMYSLGVIGGADGPTAIFVTGPNDHSILIAAAVLVVAVVGIVLLRKAKR